MLNDLEVDEDIAKLNLYRLQQLYMRSRQDARKALESLTAHGNKNCWDDAIETNLNLLTPKERNNFRLGRFDMSFLRTISNCALWILYQKKREQKQS